MKLNPQILVLVATLSLTSLQAMASPTSQTDCQNENCMDEQTSQKVLSKIEISQLPEQVRLSLQAKANELAQIWGDTILEGDYYADDVTTLDQVEMVFNSGHHVGYRITYSSPAWDTSSCRFDSLDLSTLNGCEQGRIVESGYVSQDLKFAYQDRQAFATFQGSQGSR